MASIRTMASEVGVSYHTQKDSYGRTQHHYSKDGHRAVVVNLPKRYAETHDGVKYLVNFAPDGISTRSTQDYKIRMHAHVDAMNSVCDRAAKAK